MLSRRALVAGAALAVAGVCGCSLVPPDAGLPGPGPRPTRTPDAATSAFLRVHQALTDAHAAEQDAARSQLLAWALDVSSEQASAIGWPVARPTPTASAPTPAPSSHGEPTSPAPAPQALVMALTDAIEAYRGRVVDPATAQPLVWASMRAWASALVPSLDRPQVQFQTALDRLPPPVQTVAEAAQSATTAVAEALYAIETAGGAPGLSPDHLAWIRGRVVFWRQLRDDVQRTWQTSPSTSPSPTPGPAWHHVPRPADTAAAFALVARVQGAALPILGRSLAFGTDALRSRLTDAIADLAVDQPGWGAPLARWPGWPTT